MDALILSQLADRLTKIGRKIGFADPVMRSDGYSSEVYIRNHHALELEIDWRENNLFIYVVYLKNGTLPDKGVIYCYADGQWCRKFLEEIYQIKRPYDKNRENRYSPSYLFDCMAFYEKLISDNPTILSEFYNSIDQAE